MSNKIKNIKFIKFLVIGTGNTLFLYLLYVSLIFWGLHHQLALLLDYVVGVFSGYIFNRYWTFSDRKKINKSFLKYMFTYIGIYFVNVVLLEALVVYLNIGVIFAQFISLIIVVLLSFILQNKWVFRSNNLICASNDS